MMQAGLQRLYFSLGKGIGVNHSKPEGLVEGRTNSGNLGCFMGVE
jgi:hypothetical protein